MSTPTLFDITNSSATHLACSSSSGIGTCNKEKEFNNKGKAISVRLINHENIDVADHTQQPIRQKFCVRQQKHSFTTIDTQQTEPEGVHLCNRLQPEPIELQYMNAQPSAVSNSGWNLLVASDQDGTLKNEVWAYDPIFRKWAQRGPMIVPRASFACCVWNGKILVAGGFTESEKLTSKAEMYDPDTDTWDPIPDLEHTRDSACIGFVIDGAVHVVNTVLKEVQVLENLKDKWRRSHLVNHELMTVVNGSLYGMNYYQGDIYKLECGIWKVVASASELNNRMGYAMMGFRDDIYVIGGWRGIKPISDVDVLLLGNEN
ncbi:F-box/kelch-repeat protein SKIP30 [Tanacetum coccineum]